MARIRLGRFEVSEGQLPAVCMRCGEPAERQVHKQFSWHPPWVILIILAGLLPYVILALILTKRMTIRAPMCQLHRGHWWKRQLFITGGFLALLVLLGVCIFFAVDVNAKLTQSQTGFLFLGWSLLFLIYLIAALVVQYTSIRPKEITDTSISLTGVAPAFVSELRVFRAEQWEQDADDEDARGGESRGRKRHLYRYDEDESDDVKDEDDC
jgi:hypothetical protein